MKSVVSSMMRMSHHLGDINRHCVVSDGDAERLYLFGDYGVMYKCQCRYLSCICYMSNLDKSQWRGVIIMIHILHSSFILLKS